MNSQGPTLTVIVPTLNACRTLENCLSLLLECPISMEILVCDGGSSDDTQCIATNKGKKVHLIDCSDIQGIYGAMNRGLDQAKGEWIYFSGANDFVASPDAFESMLKDLKPETELVIGKVRNLPPRHKHTPEWYSPQWGKEIILRNIVHHQGALYKKTLFDAYRYPEDLKVFGDYHLNLNLFKKSAKVELKEVHLAEASGEGVSKQFTPKLYAEEFRMKRSILPFGQWIWQPLWLVLKFLRRKL